MRVPDPSVILGISADYHDAAAALVIDGRIIAAAQEERFTRIKHDPSLPRSAVRWCLNQAGIEPGGLHLAVFYSKPLSTYQRILATHSRVGVRGFPALAKAVSSWSTSKLWISYRIDRLLAELQQERVPLAFTEHHQSHAAAAFFPSPFEQAAILTFDGVGERATAAIGEGRGNHIRLIEHINFPDSIGLFYSSMTAYCGFAVNDGEFKLMGLAPYGTPRFANILKEHAIHVDAHGGVHLNQRFFDYRAGRRMTHPRLAHLLDGPPRRSEDPLGQREADIAASTQAVLEEVVLAVAHRAHRLTGKSEVCLAGGVALNCVANARLAKDGPFDDIWIQPASGDDGSAAGAALWAWHQIHGQPRTAEPNTDGMSGMFLGPAFAQQEITEWLTDNDIPFTTAPSAEVLYETVAEAIDAGSLVGWFTGAMEFGPRALGHRSILADPRDPGIVTRLNLAVKGREGFRPFAPAVLAEEATAWFDLDKALPYMLMTTPVHGDQLRSPETATYALGFTDRLSAVRSTIPACTHVDYSARVQTVDQATNPEFHGLLSAFHRRTGCPVLVNTSFNRDGEPIVCSPADALRCFHAAGLDLLALEGCLIRRRDLLGAR